MARGSLTTDQVLALLVDHWRRLEPVAGVSEDQVQTRPGLQEWSANEVLAHVRSCADVWGGCIERILSEDRPTIRAVNPRTWIESTDYLDLDFQSSFRSFKRQRRALLRVLVELPAEAWRRSATVTGAGKPLGRTVLSYAEWMATHERAHVKQIERAASAQ